MLSGSREEEVRGIGAVVVWILLGLIAGALAKWVMPGPDPGGIIVTILVGMGGALLGGFVVGWLFGGGGPLELSFGSVIVATLGALALLALYRLITRRTV